MTKHTLQINYETKDLFEKARFKFKLKERRLITQDEFVKILLKKYKK